VARSSSSRPLGSALDGLSGVCNVPAGNHANAIPSSPRLARVARRQAAPIRAYSPPPRIAVLVPCMNEEAAVASVVASFRDALPDADVYVYDNNSTDRTAEAARDAGAVVGAEVLQGKGHVVRRMFSDIEADVYVLVDGDDTYDAASSPAMIAKLLDEQLDMVNAYRLQQSRSAYRPGHRFGNALLSAIVAFLFGKRFNDLLSGYRVFSRRYVKSFPALATGFEIETELTVHALELRMPVAEVVTAYRERPAGSVSKLRTCRDGLRILTTIVNLMKGERPLLFFSIAFAALATLAMVLIHPVLMTYRHTGLVPRLPTAILSTGIMLFAFLCLFSGLILDTVTHGRRELKRLRYLEIPAPRRTGGHGSEGEERHRLTSERRTRLR
jgi:Glycosyl transferase family 2